MENKPRTKNESVKPSSGFYDKKLLAMRDRLCYVYKHDITSLTASRTMQGAILGNDVVNNLKRLGLISPDLMVEMQMYSPSLLFCEDSESPTDLNTQVWSHLNSFINGSMSLLSRHAHTRGLWRSKGRLGADKIPLIDLINSCYSYELHRISMFGKYHNLCTKIMEQMSFVFDVNMYIKDHQSINVPLLYIGMDGVRKVELKWYPTCDGFTETLPDICINSTARLGSGYECDFSSPNGFKYMNWSFSEN